MRPKSQVTALKPTQKSKKLQLVLSYLVVSEIHAGTKVYNQEGKHNASFEAYYLIVNSFFKADKFPFNDPDFKSIFDVREYSHDQLMSSTSTSKLLPNGVWEKGMEQRKFQTKYIAEHGSRIRQMFMLKNVPSASAEDENDEDKDAISIAEDDINPKDMVIEIPSGTTLEDLLGKLRLSIYQAEHSANVAVQKAGGIKTVQTLEDDGGSDVAAQGQIATEVKDDIPSEVPAGHVDTNWIILMLLFFKADKAEQSKCQFLLTLLSYVTPGGQKGLGTHDISNASTTHNISNASTTRNIYYSP